MNWVEREMFEVSRVNVTPYLDAWIIKEPSEPGCLHHFEVQTVPAHVRHRYRMSKRSRCAKCGVEA